MEEWFEDYGEIEEVMDENLEILYKVHPHQFQSLSKEEFETSI